VIHVFFFVYLFLQQATAPAANSPQTQLQTPSASPMGLWRVKRIYVDSFGDDPISKEMQSMIVSALVSSKRFVVTENRERADATLRGLALENTQQELHAFHDSTVAGRSAISDSSTSTETTDKARISLRLINPDGDVIWTTTQESKGAKYKGASADAADMCVKQLMRDMAKLEVANPATPNGAPAPTPSIATHP
jgi:curli biogenesis system outer membrane secretion channel CsgG